METTAAGLEWTSLSQTNMSTPGSEESGDEPGGFTTPVYLMITITALYASAFVLGISGNIIAVIVLIKNRFLFETTGPSLLNLAVADLLVLLFAQPTAVMEFFTQEVWYLGQAMCKIVPLVENAVANASLLTILFISVERYFAICHPLRVTSGSIKSKTKLIMTAIWVVAFMVSSPLLVITQYKYSLFYDKRLVPVCRSTVSDLWKQTYVISLLCVFYLIPGVMFVFLYSAVIRRLTIDSSQMVLLGKQTEASRNALHGRQQVVRLMIFLIFLFFACVLPFRIVSIWLIYAPKSTVRNLGVQGYLWLTHFPRCLVYVNSAVNPVLYNLISKKFRKAFIQTLVLNRCSSTEDRTGKSKRKEQFKLLPQSSVNSLKTTSIHLPTPSC